ncbi:MAG: TIGR04255 family protein [Bacteroidales bacterium]|nr:TIGR04255 family protein [Bacteroidales bacterium]
MELPVRIVPCPIIDSVIEIRFETKIHPSAVFGVIYNELNQKYPKVDNLPLSQMPESLREKDPNLMYKPVYKITDGKYIIQIGPKVITISSPQEYIGWKEFSQRIQHCIEVIYRLKIVEKITRIGLRYVNFFEYNIFDEINLGVIRNGQPLKSDNINVRTELKESSFTHMLQVANKVNLNKDKFVKNGSIIDIDTFRTDKLSRFFTRSTEIIEAAHIAEKKLFFGLLTSEWIKKHNPEYKNGN